MELYSDKLSHSLWITFKKVSEFNVDDVWDIIFKVAQSSRGFSVDEPIRIKVDFVKMPVGAGRVYLDCANVRKNCIKNVIKDNLCLPRAIAVGSAYAVWKHFNTEKYKNLYESMRRENSVTQKKFAQDLVKNANVTVLTEGCHVEEIEQFQRYIAKDGFVIKVFKFVEFNDRKPPFYDGTQTVIDLFGSCGTFEINLFYYDGEPGTPGHYKACTSLTAALCKEYCEHCHSGVTNLLTHRCTKKCKRCLSPNCTGNITETVQCEHCNRLFYGENCLQNHRLPRSYIRGLDVTVCNAVKYCDLCNKQYRAFSTDKKKSFPLSSMPVTENICVPFAMRKNLPIIYVLFSQTK